ncbi:MAG: glutamine synthetase type III, partial [Candidatus Faecousia sp.]|nr:glutamine synthetase type III [Candidatus Faecousia sp.]
VAPAQHELAPIFTTTNIAADHNQLTMEMMQKVAKRHGLVCLLHEKPFDGVNGSGKHNNWSISTDTGMNLLEPGETPYENAQFLLFLCAVIKAVDEYQDLLRITVASAGNDHRLGANEAPPAIVSMFLGSDLSEILDAIEKEAPYDGHEKEVLRIGVHTLPKFQKDATDRNRTSPFAFTGNKFEFRMLGSSESISCANTVLNTSVAEELKQFADILEGAENFEATLHELIRKTIAEHKRIIFNGDGYDASWVKEAERRGLLNLKTTPDALAHLLDKKNIDLFAAHNVYSETELVARHEVKLENYCKVVNIEAQTMLDMARKDYLPAMARYTADLSAGITAKLNAIPDSDCSYERDSVKTISALLGAAHRAAGKLERDLLESKSITDSVELADFFKTTIIDDMCALRISVDSMESTASAAYWPVPSYGEMLFGVR